MGDNASKDLYCFDLDHTLFNIHSHNTLMDVINFVMTNHPDQPELAKRLQNDPYEQWQALKGEGIYKEIRTLIEASRLFANTYPEFAANLVDKNRDGGASQRFFILDRTMQGYHEQARPTAITTIGDIQKWRDTLITLASHQAVALTSFNAFPQFIPLFLQQELGLPQQIIDKIHVEAWLPANAAEADKNQHIERAQAAMFGAANPPHSIMLIDDSMRNIKAAQQAGHVTVLAQNNASHLEIVSNQAAQIRQQNAQSHQATQAQQRTSNTRPPEDIMAQHEERKRRQDAELERRRAEIAREKEAAAYTPPAAKKTSKPYKSEKEIRKERNNIIKNAILDYKIKAMKTNRNASLSFAEKHEIKKMVRTLKIGLLSKHKDLKALHKSGFHSAEMEDFKQACKAGFDLIPALVKAKKSNQEIERSHAYEQVESYQRIEHGDIASKIRAKAMLALGIAPHIRNEETQMKYPKGKGEIFADFSSLHNSHTQAQEPSPRKQTTESAYTKEDLVRLQKQNIEPTFASIKTLSDSKNNNEPHQPDEDNTSRPKPR